MAQALTTGPPVKYSDGWLRHDIPGTPFFVNETPKGSSFHVLEAGAAAWGGAHAHGKRGSLRAALKLAEGLVPSTPADIMARVKETTPYDHETFDRMAYLAEPGRRLWVLPVYGDDGYIGLGEAATAAGLHASGIEMMFGSPSSVWCVAFTTDSGRESQLHPIALSTVEEAREKWWILSHDGRNLVSGGHSDRARMERLALDYPGSQVYQGCMFIREDGSVFTTLVSFADPYLAELTARRKADRAAMARRVVDLAGEYKLAAWHRPELPGTKRTDVDLECPHGLKVTVRFEASGTRAPDTYLLSWHGVEEGVRLHPGMFNHVNPCHGCKATDVAHGFAQLLRILRERFAVIRDDSAFIRDPESAR